MPAHYSYSRWDGTQTGFELDADDLLGELTDDLLYHGDLNAALRRLLQQGFTDRDGDRLQGVRELLQKLRQQRQQRLEDHDLGGIYRQVADALDEVVDTEQAALNDLMDRARHSGDQRRIDSTTDSVGERRAQLDLMPPDLAGRVRELQQYDFVSADAARRFEELMEQLREELANQYLQQVSKALGEMTPEDLQRVKDMLAELNQMLDQRRRGEEPDFDGFMERYGDFFPENPRDLDELLEILAHRMAAAQAVLNSMTPEQRAQLSQLMSDLMADMDLQWELDQLGGNLRDLVPDAGWDNAFRFSGQSPLPFGQAADVLGELADMDQLEQMLQSASMPANLAEVDLDKVRDLLGDDAARSLKRLSELAKLMEEAGLVQQKEGRLELTPRGLRRLGQHALSDLFSQLTDDTVGQHEVAREGQGHERDFTTKPYEWGDPFNLHIGRTMRNAVARSGAGTPVRLLPEDFEVERTEHLTRTSTVLLVDLSLSMPMRGNFLPAKKVAMALHALISTQFPRDHLGIIGFSNLAYEIQPEQLPEVSWDFVYGTNMQHALLLARSMLARHSGTKQVIMITDGEPTAHLVPGSDEPYFEYPPVPATLEATLREVGRCTQAGIRINTFVLDATPSLRRFIEQMTQLNRGRAFFTTPESLGSYVLVDFVEHRRQKVISPRAG